MGAIKSVTTHMKTLVTTLLFSFLSFSARAEWTQISESSTVAIYLDISSINTVRGYVRGWTLWSQKQGGSTKQLEEMDCPVNENRTIYMLAYEGAMGEGKMWLSNDSVSPFKPVVPGTVGATVLNTICGLVKK